VSEEKTPALPGATRDRTWANRRLGEYLLLSEADIALINALKPHCAVCNRPVERIAWFRTIDHRAITFVIQCHGATEETKIHFDDLPALMQGGVQGAVAFQQKAVCEQTDDRTAPIPAQLR
jgi:hypothetical protein